MILKEIWIGLLAVLVCVGGCTANKVTSRWRDGDIVANGSDSEWQFVPQYYDEKRPVSIRVTNDAEALYLCITTSDEAIKRHLRMAGLTLWFDPMGENERVFGIHLPGDESRASRQRPRPGAGRVPSAEDHGGRSLPNEPALSPFEAPNKLAVTYAGATGPLTMTLVEVRRTGIDIGVGQLPGGRLVYEFGIAFKAAPSLSGLAPRKVVGIGILAGALEKDRPEKRSSKGLTGTGNHWGGMEGGGSGEGMGTLPGGPMGERPGGPGPGKMKDSLEVWLQVRLADRGEKNGESHE